ncbi:hypothetical protein TTRE_0000185201 [Trichuris trichiura]|uniref:Uncharacterized protein n=1 Tax=Trichuris trichiura TaxID=36087 RepID=A0A077YZP7_TRITR|nr:hypothetical protein TTRE_0000185201 [Trichuris trichiura]
MLPHKRQSVRYCYNFEPQTWCQNRCKRCFRLKEHHSSSLGSLKKDSL